MNNRQSKKLGELFRVCSSKRVLKSQWRTEGVPFYRGREVTHLSNEGYVDNELFVSKDLYSDFAKKYGVPNCGDIIITAIGTIGNTYVVRENDKFYFKDASVLWLDRITDIDSNFINYWFKSTLFTEQLEKGNGATVDTLTIQKLQSLIVDVPALAEQKRIVKILDEVFGGIEKAKENEERNLKNSQELFESYLQNVFANSGKDWEEKKLGEVCDVEYGYTEKAKSHGDYRFVRITDTDENGLLTQEKKMYIDSFADAGKYTLNDGDLLMARVGASAGNVLLFEGSEKSVFASYLIRMRFKKEIMSKLYWHFSKSRLYWSQVGQLSAGSAQPQFNGGALKQVSFPFPKSLLEQKAIIKKLDALSGETKKLEAIFRRKIADLDELKKSVLKQAFSGEL